MSIPPRSPVPDILAASPKQPDALKEHIRALLAQAWSTNPQPDLERFVLNARARSAPLRACSSSVVAQVAREMRLALTNSDTTVAKAAVLRKSWVEEGIAAPEQARRANEMTAAAIAEYTRLQAVRRPR
jgi:hypothetical protein